MNISEAFTIVIRYLLEQTTNFEMIEFYKDILLGIGCGEHVEQACHPSHKSILKFGTNIFPFSDNKYIEIAKDIKVNKQ